MVLSSLSFVGEAVHRGGTAPRIGLISHGGDNPQATAVFDDFRVHR